VQVDTEELSRLALRVLDAQGRVMVHEDWGMSSGLRQCSLTIEAGRLGHASLRSPIMCGGWPSA